VIEVGKKDMKHGVRQLDSFSRGRKPRLDSIEDRGFRPRLKSVSMFALVALLGVSASSCRKIDMVDQPKAATQEPSDFFADGRSSRPHIEGTVARGQLRTDRLYYFGLVKGPDGKEHESAEFPTKYPDGKPFPRQGPELEAMLQRGKSQFMVFCYECHGATGEGDGMIVRRGFPKPPSYLLPVAKGGVKDKPVGHYFGVITNGFGAMFSYHERVEVADRWAIAGYIRALQLSQDATMDDVKAAGVSLADTGTKSETGGKP